jgi:DNA polymerase-3 subunit gamma/tau
MTYQVLARKWRPQTFDDVVGQGTVMRTLKNALASGRIGHAFLFSGARGVGKTTTARLLAKALNCAAGEGPAAEPCNTCTSCQEITAGSSLDVQEIDGATNNSVDQVRELRESARYNPARDRFRVWIIDEVHMLSTGAFNALLKTLEEPPPRVKFIFATTEYHKLPDTILSRCQQYDFRLIPAREIQQHLRHIADAEGIRVSDEALARVARAAEGSARDGLSLFDQVLSFSAGEVKDEDVSALLGLIDRELLLGASQAALQGDTLGVLELVERLSDYGADYRNFARELLLHFREILLIKVAPAESALLAPIVPEERERLRPLAAAFSEEDLLRIFDVLTRVEGELRQATDPRVTLELALLKLTQMRRLVPFAELVARVERLAPGNSLDEVPAAGRVRLPDGAGAPEVRRVSTPAPVPAPMTNRGASVQSTAEDERAPKAAHGAAGLASATHGSASLASADPRDASPRRAAPLDAQSVLDGMREVFQTRPTLAMPLRGAQAEFQGETLVLRVAAEFAPMVAGHLDELTEAARKVMGRPLALRLSRPEEPARAASTPTPAEEQDARLMRVASDDPAVRDALELFNGKVVAVRAPDNG